MKKNIFLFFLLLLSIAGYSQAVYSYGIMYDGKGYTVNKQSVVKDASGKKLEYEEWTTMMQTGNYKLTTYSVVNSVPTEFLVRLLTDAEKKDIDQQNTIRQRMASGVELDKPIPSFAMTDINGKTWSSSELKGKIVVLNFWFIKCQPCIAEMPELNKMAIDYKNNNDIVFLAITPADKPAEILEFLKTHEFSYNQISNEFGKAFCQKNGIMGFPTNVLIRKDGTVHKSYTGYKSGLVDILREDIKSLISK